MRHPRHGVAEDDAGEDRESPDDLLAWASFDLSWTQRYAVESVSRMLYTFEHGEVVSKRHALDWAAEAMPAEWCNL